MTKLQNHIPPVSLIVVNYNAGNLLVECIVSAIDQVQEAVIVDNASSDTSLQQLKKHSLNKSSLSVIENKDNMGFSVACNIGIEHSKNAYLLFLNPDCILESNSVRALLEVLENNPEAGMVGGLLKDFNGQEQAGARRAVPTPWRSFVRAFGLHRFSHRWPGLFFDFHLHKQPLPDKPIEVEALSGACMLIKREALDSVGGWDEDYFLHCEDLDLCMRFRQNGWKIMFVPDAHVTHFAGKCSENTPVFVEWHKHKGMIRFYQKFFKHQYPGVLMWLVISGVWLRFSFVASVKSLKLLVKKLKIGA